MINIIIAGVGGQGTVLASKLIAQAGMKRGLQVRTSETIGMAQRGGCVVSHVRLGEAIASPLVPVGSADVIIGFEPAEAARCLHYLKPDGIVIVSKAAIKPVTDSLARTDYNGDAMLQAIAARVRRLCVIDSDAILAACGSAKVLNTAMLGAAVAAGVLGITLADLEATIRERMPARFVAMNLQALQAGAQAFSEGQEQA